MQEAEKNQIPNKKILIINRFRELRVEVVAMK